MVTIILNMTWDEPEKSYGTIENYQLRILRQNVKSGDLVTTAIEVSKTHQNEVKKEEVDVKTWVFTCFVMLVNRESNQDRLSERRMLMLIKVHSVSMCR